MVNFSKASTDRSPLLRKPLADLARDTAQPSQPRLVAVGAEPQNGDLGQIDPMDVLTSIKSVAYEWDIVTGALHWGANAGRVPKLQRIAGAKTAAAFIAMISADGQAARRDAILMSGESDRGAGVPFQLAYGLMFANRDSVHVEETGRWFAGPDGKPARARGLIRAVDSAFMPAPVRAALARDPQTGLHNRGYLVEMTARLFEQSARAQSTFAFLLASIDNQAYGYDVADEVIAGVAGKLRKSLRAGDLIARYSGNRFALLLEACDADQMAQAAQRFLNIAAEAPVATSVGNLPVSLRIGGVIAPRQARGPRSLIQHAEEALDIARERPGQRFVAYMSNLVRDEARLRALTMSDDITSALNERRIKLALQPVVEAKTGKTAFCEALMRFENADGSFSQPASIFPTAEKIGLAQLLDHRVLELAAAALAADSSLTLAVNCSGATAYDPEWPERLASLLSGRGGLAERLIIEVTETCAIADIEATQRIFAQMRGIGVRIAMDDFGAGHTSFRNLRALQVDILKIDGAFVQNLSRSADDRFFVRTLVELARHLGIETVAEWVEDAGSAKILADWGVTYLQGNYFGAAEIPQAPSAETGRARLIA
jgi:diguanylate cyclase (GGDEF)-like protein